MADEIQAKSQMPPPILIAAIICDWVIIDHLTKKPSIIGAFEVIGAPSYPARHGRLAFFCQLTNGHGKTPVTVKLVDVQKEDQTLFNQTIECEFQDVRAVKNLTFDISGIVFPHPGEYRFQIFAGTNFLGERRIICGEIKMNPGGNSNA